MQEHVMIFSSFITKRIAIDWVQEHIGPNEENEELTKLRYTFYTDIELSRPLAKRMMQEIPYLQYVCRDF